MLNNQAKEDLLLLYNDINNFNSEKKEFFWDVLECAGCETEFREFLYIREGDIIYFELNNWIIGEDYPDHEPFISWMGNDLSQSFLNEKWVKENKLIVAYGAYDMSINYYIAAPKTWVIENCGSLLNEDKKFLLTPDEDGFIDGRFGLLKMPYDKEHIGKIFRVKECEDSEGFLYYYLES